MSAPSAGRLDALDTTDSVEAYAARLVRLTRVEAMAGQFLAASLESVVDAEAYAAVARDYAEQALTIRRELADWRDGNPDTEGRW